MPDGVWGNVKDWGLREHGDGSSDFSSDPVCGKPVEEIRAARKTAYCGVTYFFCSKECQTKFEEAPGSYTGQPLAPSRREVDVNLATAEEIKDLFHVDDDGANHIIAKRPYHNWAEFKRRNPGFSDPMLECLRQAGVGISPQDLHRLR